MDNSLFDKIPWFIRKKIIFRVVLVQSQYAVVCREWLKCLLNSQGITYVSEYTNEPVNLTRKGYFDKYAKTIAFSRGSEFNWVDLHNKQSIEELAFLNVWNSEITHEFIKNVSKFPPIKRLTILACGEKSGLEFFFELQRGDLLELVVKTFDFDPGFYIEGAVFPKLKVLELNHLIDGYINHLSIVAPNLKTLRLNLINIAKVPFPPHESKFPNIVELFLTTRSRNDQSDVIKLDLTKLPYLKKVVLAGAVDLIQHQTENLIEELYIDLHSEFFNSILQSNFCNLKKLFVNLESSIVTKLINFLASCSKLATLQLYNDNIIELKPNLLTMTFPHILSLRLSGCFTANYPFLSWFFLHFPSIHKIELEFLGMYPPTDCPQFPFPHLKHLIVAANCASDSWRQSNFNHRLYPQVDFIEFVNSFEAIFKAENCIRFEEGCR